jgi:hypothetical protein
MFVFQRARKVLKGVCLGLTQEARCGFWWMVLSVNTVVVSLV